MTVVISLTAKVGLTVPCGAAPTARLGEIQSADHANGPGPQGTRTQPLSPATPATGSALQTAPQEPPHSHTGLGGGHCGASRGQGGAVKPLTTLGL